MLDRLKKFGVFLMLMVMTQMSFAQKEEQRVNFPGWAYSMVPPSDSFRIANYTWGFKHVDTNNIAILGVSDMIFPFDFLRKNFEKHKAKRDKFRLLQIDTVIKSQRFYIEKVRSLYFELGGILSDLSEKKDSTDVVRWTALAEFDTAGLVMSGMYLAKDDSTMHDAFFKSILSIKSRDSTDVNPMDAMAFTIDLSHTGMRYASPFLQVGGWFSNTGNMAFLGPTDQNYSVCFLRGLGNLSQQRAEELEKAKNKGHIVLGQEEFTSKGLQGWEYFYRDTSADDKSRFHYKALLLGPSDITFIISGNSKKGVRKPLKWYRRMTRTIVPKPF